MKKGSKSTHHKRTLSRRQTDSSFIKGLHISRQDTMQTQSQASVYSQRTEKTQGTLGSQDMDIPYEQFDRDEMREVFVSEEEEKVIQKILQIARKGKITQKNAFQIPMKLADQQNFNISQTKFWKFASELLGASIHIFDKRIENTWNSTNMVHDKLIRLHLQKNSRKTMGENDQQNQKQDPSHQSGRDQFILLPIQEFRDPKILDNARIGEETLQDLDKLDSKKLRIQSLFDPLFTQKLKAFDNNSLKGLLLNIFSVGNKCEVKLFSDNQKDNQSSNSHFVSRGSAQYQYPQLNQIVKQGKQHQQIGILADIRIFKQTYATKNTAKQEQEDQKQNYNISNVREDVSEGMLNQFQALLGMDKQNFHHQIAYNQDYNNQVQVNEGNQNIDPYEPSNCLSVQQTQSIYKMSDDYFFSSYNSDMDKSFHSAMTPWEMQFKHGKLQKKKIARKKGTKSRQSRKMRDRIQLGFVDFDFLIMEQQKTVLKKDNRKQKTNNSKKTHYNNNLIPQQLIVYQKMNFRKLKKFQISQQQQQKSQQNLQLPQFLAEPSMLDHYDKNIETCVATNQGQTDDIFGMNSYEGQFFQSNQKDGKRFSLQRNIRQFKKAIFQEIKEVREMRISELGNEVSPGNALITFLHIAGQKNMVVRNTQNEDDIILSWE